MDPITAAILAVLPGIAGDTVKSAVKDAYEGLKAVIRRKWGDTAPVTKAITALEQDPKSQAQAAVLAEKINQANALHDTDVAQALDRLVQQMKARGVAPDVTANIHFVMSGGVVQGIAGAGTVNVGTMTFGPSAKES